MLNSKANNEYLEQASEAYSEKQKIIYMNYHYLGMSYVNMMLRSHYHNDFIGKLKRLLQITNDRLIIDVTVTSSKWITFLYQQIQNLFLIPPTTEIQQLL